MKSEESLSRKQLTHLQGNVASSRALSVTSRALLERLVPRKETASSLTGLKVESLRPSLPVRTPRPRAGEGGTEGGRWEAAAR